MADPTLAVQPWYHGLLPREDIKSFLRDNGDFIVRMSEPATPGKRDFVLSIMVEKDKDDKKESHVGNSAVKHFVIQKSCMRYSIEKEQQFDSVVELVNHFLTSKTSISSQRQVILKTPIGRRSWQLEHCDVECTKKLGEGAFGEVHKGKLRRKRKGAVEFIDVAIKLAKLDNLTKEQIKEIMREARLMRFFDHPNVVRLYGVAAGMEPLMLVMELASDGALDSYLQKTACDMPKKMQMIVQSAWGIEYLHEHNCLHRDIASRNCLYGQDKVKISDFGLSRPGNIYQMNPKNKVPIRWLAPETLRTAMYSQKTDVWSFGIMCWEIIHNGQEPYPGMSVAEMNGKVKDGYRMPLADIPGLSPEVVTFIEKRLWAESPNERYSMADAAKALERLTNTARPDFSKQVDKERSDFKKTDKRGGGQGGKKGGGGREHEAQSTAA